MMIKRRLVAVVAAVVLSTSAVAVAQYQLTESPMPPSKTLVTPAAMSGPNEHNLLPAPVIEERVVFVTKDRVVTKVIPKIVVKTVVRTKVVTKVVPKYIYKTRTVVRYDPFH